MAVRVARTSVQLTDRVGEASARGAFLAELARAYYEQDLTQAQIADLHRLSRSQVSRYLQEARDEGIVQIRVIAPGDRDRDLEASLRIAFPSLREVGVARVFDREATLVRRAVGRLAAQLVDRLVRPGQIVCLGAGRTMASVAGMLQPHPVPGVIVVPATGNAGHAALESDYAAVTHVVASAWQALAYVINAPAILGAGASATRLERTNPQIGQALAAARRADLFVLGLGSLAGDEIFVRTGLISADELGRVRRAGAVGDLCGNFFDVDGSAVAGPFRDRVVGIGLDDIRAAAMSVVCAGGPEKVPAIAAALRGGVAHALVTDEHTARGVLDVADGRGTTVVHEQTSRARARARPGAEARRDPEGSEGG